MDSPTFYQGILENISDGLIIVDATAEIIFFNKAAEEITGHNHDEMLGKPYSTALILDDGSSLFDSTKKIKNNTKSSSRIKTKSGDLKYINYRVSQAKFINKDYDLTVITFNDITAEFELQRIKDNFLSIASHQLRTPLSAIKGNLEMVLRGEAGDLPSTVHEYLDDSYLAVQRLAKLVKDFLNMSRLEEGRMVFDIKTFDLSSTVERSVKELTTLANLADIKLAYKKSKTKLVVKGDAEKVAEVLENLVGNAIKFTPKGSITVSHEKKGNMIITHVKDTGRGVAPENLSKLFQKYSQVVPRLEDYQGGSGLGLYISRMYIERMGGTIWVKSVYGKGSTFSFSLPLS